MTDAITRAGIGRCRGNWNWLGFDLHIVDCAMYYVKPFPPFRFADPDAGRYVTKLSGSHSTSIEALYRIRYWVQTLLSSQIFAVPHKIGVENFSRELPSSSMLFARFIGLIWLRLE